MSDPTLNLRIGLTVGSMDPRFRAACEETLTAYDNLTAERDRLREVIDRAAKAWMLLEPQVAWEGDLADAMAAGVAEIERLTAERDRLALEAARFDWFFGPADKSKFMQAYMAGVRAGFTADHWREAIDAALQEKHDE